MAIITSTSNRIEVLELRLRIERAAMEAYERVCQPQKETMTINIPERLAFILGIIPEGHIEEALGTIRLARHVYSKSSDVLHGRSSMMSVPNVVITEWRQVVDRLDEILGLSSSGT